MRIFFLGTNAGIANYHRACQCYAVVCDEDRDCPVFLIDCGTGSYRQLVNPKCVFRSDQIHSIFITHMHSDHAGGLLEILSSDYFRNRKHPLHIFGPVGLQAFLHTTIEFMKVELEFNLLVKEFDLPLPEGHPNLMRSPADKLLHLVQNLQLPRSNISIHTFPLYHTITSHGYLLIRTDNRSRTKRTLVLLGDTANSDSFVKAKSQHKIPPIDVLVHESTFYDDERERAISLGHSTNVMALDFAHKIGAKVLILFHFSSRYPERFVNPQDKRQSIPISDIVHETAAMTQSVRVFKSYDFFDYHVN